jgi:AraC-like DNA-binding protein
MQGDGYPTLKARLTGSTFDEMVEALRLGYGSFEAWRLGRDVPLDWSVDYWATDKLSLVSNRDNGGWRVRTSPNTPETLTLVLPRSGAISLSALSRDVTGTPGKLLLINNHEPDLVSVAPGQHFAESLSLNWESIAQAYAAVFEAPLIGSLDISQALDLDGKPATLLNMLWQTIYVGVKNDGPLLRCPIALSNLTEALADIIVRTVPHRASQLLDKKIHLVSPGHVCRAIEYMHANINQPILIREVAVSVGVSIRALEFGFRMFKDRSPSEFLREMRLRAVRNDLLDLSNNEPMSKICLKWGFFHFGRFSSIYRASFGETPSETRQRRGSVF